MVNPEGPGDTLLQLLETHGLTPATRLFRTTLPEFLGDEANADSRTLSANPTPSEAVVDVYGNGHITLAEHIGPGLAFVESADNEWCTEGRVLVEINIADVIDQGGKIYPVESVSTDRAWYATLPNGSIRVTATPGDTAT